MADAKYWADKAEQYIRDWRVCACRAEVEGKITMGIYNTECGHAIDCDYYLADSLQKHLSGHKPLAPRRGGMAEVEVARYVDHYQGARQQDRRTPREFFDRLDLRFGFTLDGAASPENALLPMYSCEAVPLPWKGERVFCNPPWSNIPPFIELAPQAELAVLLVPARTNCKWFHRALALGAKPEYWLGKLNFSGKWNSPIDCLLLIWEPQS